jgi:hypothetical protein
VSGVLHILRRIYVVQRAGWHWNIPYVGQGVEQAVEGALSRLQVVLHGGQRASVVYGAQRVLKLV